MKPVGVNSSTSIDFNKEYNNEDPKYEAGNLARISKYKKFLATGYTQICPKRFFWLKIFKIVYRADVLLVILMAEKLLEAFMKNHCKRQIKQDLG